MRRMPPLAAPVTMTQTVRLLAPEERDTERAHIGAMPHVAGEALGIRDRDAAGRADGVELLWERHSEASTTTIISPRSEEHTSELQSLMRISYAVFCLKTKKNTKTKQHN